MSTPTGSGACQTGEFVAQIAARSYHMRLSWSVGHKLRRMVEWLL